MNLANKITIVRISLIPLFIFTLQQYPLWLAESSSLIRHMNHYGIYWAIVIFLLASLTDKLDGYIARKYNQITNLGKLLDPLADKLLVTAALIMMVKLAMIPSWIAIVIIGRELFVSFIRIVAAAQGVALAADKHGKLKLVFQVVAIIAVLLGNYPFSVLTDFPVDRTIMIVAVAVTAYSGYIYMKNNFKKLKLSI